MTLTATDSLSETAARASPLPDNSQAADLEHPWLGLESFREETRAYFFGRDSEIMEIHLRLRSHPLLVLYGRSGLGKTSILNAGLIPRLREEKHNPALHRLAYKDDDPSPIEQLFYLLFYDREQKGAWRYVEGMSRASHWWQNVLTTFPFELPSDFSSRLWLRLHWRDQSPDVTHLILDQFEEVFTVAAARAGAENDVREGLGILLQSAVPQPIARLIAEHDDFLDHFDSDSIPIRVLLALRDDYVYALNRWKRSLPLLGQNNFELRALRGPAALDAVFQPGALRCHYRGEVKEENKSETGLAPIVSSEIAERIVRFVANKGDNVPIEEIEAVPPILSLLCRELNERRFQSEPPAAKITFSESDTDVKTIIKSFYDRCIAGRPDAVRFFIEEELVSYSGARLAQDEKSILTCFDRGWRSPGATNGQHAAGYGDSAKARTCLEELINQRLLTSISGGENPSYELIHDLLAGVVEKSRLTREAERQAEQLRAEQSAQRRKQRVTVAVAAALALTLIATIWASYYAFVQEHAEYYRGFGKRHGYPVGIRPISPSEASRLPVSFRFIHKGLSREGWTIHWKPAFRVEAVNGQFQPTTAHGIVTYLWKGESESQAPQGKRADQPGERLGLRTVCKWEFVSTREGDTIYERGLDRVGHMVFGLVYSPPAADKPDERVARFVGSDGFPQFQRRSAAEYVAIHYDKAGWEDRIMYSDANNRPAAGPDGAFGQRLIHNQLGQVTQLLSLDQAGNPMIDNSGNCGMQAMYDAKGNEIEDTSIGPDLKPMIPKEGFVTLKAEYDRFGRIRRARYYGATGEPVLYQNNYHGWEIEYDKSGDAITQTYLGLDGKPSVTSDGWAIIRMSYDSRGNLVQMTFHSLNNESVLWKKEGYHGWRAEYDANGNGTVQTYLGLDEKPMLLTDGYATVKMDHDDRGNTIRMTYYDTQGYPVLSTKHYHGWQVEYDKAGNRTRLTYLGLEGRPIVIPTGYATERDDYDLHGNRIRVQFYGAHDEPVLSQKDGCHGWETQYDDKANPAVETYLGLDGKPAPDRDGKVSSRMEYDSRGNVVRTSFYGSSSEPIVSKEGYHSRRAEYDDSGRRTLETYFGLDGKPVLTPGGYAALTMDYDKLNNVIRERFYGVNREPVIAKAGYHGWEAHYDRNSRLTEETYIGLNGKPVVVATDGYATLTMGYNERGKIVRMAYYGAGGEPVLLKNNGYHGWTAAYDDKGNQTAKTYLGLDEKPMLMPDGYATIKMDYDNRQRVIQKAFYGVNGEPVFSTRDGYHGFMWEYDEKDNVAAETYLGLDGKPMLLEDGYAKVRMIHDSRGRIAHETFYGLTDEPVLTKSGYHGFDDVYDDKGNLTNESYFGFDEKPIVRSDGYARARLEYNAQGKPVKMRYYGLQDEPVRSTADGYYGWKVDYDADGNVTKKTYLDVNGEAVSSSAPRNR